MRTWWGYSRAQMRVCAFLSVFGDVGLLFSCFCSAEIPFDESKQNLLFAAKCVVACAPSVSALFTVSTKIVEKLVACFCFVFSSQSTILFQNETPHHLLEWLLWSLMQICATSASSAAMRLLVEHMDRHDLPTFPSGWNQFGPPRLFLEHWLEAPSRVYICKTGNIPVSLSSSLCLWLISINTLRC